MTPEPGEIYCGKKGDTREVVDCDGYFVRWKRAFRREASPSMFTCTVETWDKWEETAVRVKAKGAT